MQLICIINTVQSLVLFMTTFKQILDGFWWERNTNFKVTLRRIMHCSKVIVHDLWDHYHTRPVTIIFLKGKVLPGIYPNTLVLISSSWLLRVPLVTFLSVCWLLNFSGLSLISYIGWPCLWEIWLWLVLYDNGPIDHVQSLLNNAWFSLMLP